MRTRITAVLVAALALLGWSAGPGAAARAEAAALPEAASAGYSGLAIAGFAAAGVLVVIGVALLAWRVRYNLAEPPTGPALADVDAQAARSLVATDDAVRTSDQELSFVTARFGQHSAAPFAAALTAAKLELAAAFKVRQLIDEDIPETEPIKRSMLAEIFGRCAAASRLLDEQAAPFDRLQNLPARAPQVLAEVGHHVSQQDARTSRSEQTLRRLADRYTLDAVAVVATSPGQARQRLEFAQAGLAGARKALAANDNGRAAMFLQAAESAADQAESLLDGIEHVEAELTQASSALPTALRATDAGIAGAADDLTVKESDRTATIGRAEVAAAAVRGRLADGAPFDSLAALRLLEQADTALDHALAHRRVDQDRVERAMAVLDQAMLVARSSVLAADDFIDTRRGAVGAAARTRLAESQRHFQQAITHVQDNPEGALAESQHADALGQQAWSLAERDVAQFWERQQDRPGGSGRLDGAISGAVLGGILIDRQPGSADRGWDGATGLGAGDGVEPGDHGSGDAGPGTATADGYTAAGLAAAGRVAAAAGDASEFAASGLGAPGSFGGVGTRARRIAGITGRSPTVRG